MSQLSKFKILNIWVLFKKKGINSEDIVTKICKGREVIGCLNSLSLETNKRLWMNQRLLLT